MVVAARPEWIDWVAGLAPAVAVVVASIGVWIASHALKASRASAEASRKSADNSTAALEGAITPVLAFEAIEAHTDKTMQLRFENVGRGPALNIRVTAAPYMHQATHLHRFAWLSGDQSKPIAAGKPTTVGVRVLREAWDVGEPMAVEILATYEDLNGSSHYMYTRTSVSASPRTLVGKPPLTGDAENFANARQAVADELQS